MSTHSRPRRSILVPSTDAAGQDLAQFTLGGFKWLQIPVYV